MAADVFGVVIVAVLIWWLWSSRNVRKKTERQSELESIPSGRVTGTPAQRTDPFLDSIQAERLKAERVSLAEANEYKTAVEAQVSDAQALKAKLGKFARDNRLDEALVELWDAKYKWNTLGIEKSREEKSDDFRNMTVRFSYQGTEYSVVSRSWSEEEDSYIDFQLFEDAEEVFSVSCAVVFGDITRYRPLDVTAFKRRGNWASMLIQLIIKKNMEDEKFWVDLKVKNALEIKKRFAE